MKTIPLSSGRAFAIVDDDLADELLAFSWQLNHGYASRKQPRGLRPSNVYMHRQILGLSADSRVEVDHIDGNKLDNRRCNLRVATHAENGQNHRGWRRRPVTSRFRGVYYRDGYWVAQCAVGGKYHRIGKFPSEIEAAIAADEWRLANVPFAEPDAELARAQEL